MIKKLKYRRLIIDKTKIYSELSNYNKADNKTKILKVKFTKASRKLN